MHTRQPAIKPKTSDAVVDQGERKDSFVIHRAYFPEPAENLDSDRQSLETDCFHLLSVIKDRIKETEPSSLSDKLLERSVK